MKHRKVALVEVAFLVVAIVVLFVFFDFVLEMDDFWQNLVLSWVVYRIMKWQFAPRTAGLPGAVSLLDNRGGRRVMLGQPDADPDGMWIIALRCPDSEAAVWVSLHNDRLALGVDDADDRAWGFLDRTGIERMLELGILKHPRGSDGGDDSDNTPEPPSPERSTRRWWETVLYVLAG